MTTLPARHHFFLDLPIRQKLLVVFLLTTAAALVLSGAGIVIADWFLFRGYLQTELATLSRIVADNSTAALEFNEPQSAGETLAALHERAHVVVACVYRADGIALARYIRAGSEASCPPPERDFKIVSGFRGMVLSQPIVLTGSRIGTFTISYDLGEISEQLLLQSSTVFAVLALSSLVSFLLSSRLRELIAATITGLAETASSVSATKDYSIRAQQHSKDELGLMVNAFNQMLDSIQARENDLTQALADRETALREARSAHDFLHTTLSSIGDAIVLTDTQGTIVFANPAAVAQAGKVEEGDLVGGAADELFVATRESAGELVASLVKRALGELRPVESEPKTMLAKPDGTRIPVEGSAAPILSEGDRVVGVVLIYRDITERFNAEKEKERLTAEMLATEERLRQTAKLESLGVLAGGIAHDFNNLLVGMLGNASLAREMLPATSPVAPVIDDVVHASEKAAQLTHQMLAYSGRGRFIIERVDLSHVVENILPLISRPIGKNVSVHLDLAPDLPPMEADKSQLQQILMNLVINGAEACGENPGSVHIRTYKFDARSASIPPMFGLPAAGEGAFVCLDVSDTGAGMSEEVKSKIFDPFFTTKFTGRGLGLSAVLGIIRSHKGALKVESAVGAGTTFRVFFPIASGAVQSTVQQPERRWEAAAAGGTILVVDDEEIVRKAAKHALEKNGFSVVLAEDGAEGVRKFQESAETIAAVVLDLTMPVMDGEAALGQMKKIDPSVRVIMSSGFDEHELARRFDGKGLAGFLQKPYRAGKLVDSVKNAIGEVKVGRYSGD